MAHLPQHVRHLRPRDRALDRDEHVVQHHRGDAARSGRRDARRVEARTRGAAVGGASTATRRAFSASGDVTASKIMFPPVMCMQLHRCAAASCCAVPLQARSASHHSSRDHSAGRTARSPPGRTHARVSPPRLRDPPARRRRRASNPLESASRRDVPPARLPRSVVRRPFVRPSLRRVQTSLVRSRVVRRRPAADPPRSPLFPTRSEHHELQRRRHHRCVAASRASRRRPREISRDDDDDDDDDDALALNAVGGRPPRSRRRDGARDPRAHRPTPPFHPRPPPRSDVRQELRRDRVGPAVRHQPAADDRGGHEEDLRDPSAPLRRALGRVRIHTGPRTTAFAS